MNNLFILFVSLLLAFCIGAINNFAQDLRNYQKSLYVLEGIDKYPQLAVDYTESVTFKIASRKAEYRKGENLIISYAIMNSGKSPIHILKDPYPKIVIYNKDKKVVAVKDSLVHDYFPGVPFFDLFKKFDYFSDDVILLVGCEGYSDYYSKRYSSDSKTIFENSLFVNWSSNGCIDIDNTNSISIVFSTGNQNLIKNRNVKAKQYPTAAGEIKSNILELKITN
jgi:hypothetical protein